MRGAHSGWISKLQQQCYHGSLKFVQTVEMANCMVTIQLIVSITINVYSIDYQFCIIH